MNPKIAQWLPGLFCLNERAVYIGQWEHGFCSFTAVGKIIFLSIFFNVTLLKYSKILNLLNGIRSLHNISIYTVQSYVKSQ